MKFKYAYGIVPGDLSGEREASLDKIKSLDKNGVTVICLAAPPGAVEYSGFDLDLIAETTASLVADRFDELYTSEEASVKKTVLEKTGEAVWGAEIALSDMDCTLLFAAAKENRYLAGHMGGGLIARFDGGCSVLSKDGSGLIPGLPQADDDLLPEKEYLTLEDQALAALRLYRGELQAPAGFMLISGGACPSLYQDSTGISTACGTFFEWLKEYDEETVSEALVENINKYFMKDTKGDISVAFMVSDSDEAASEEAPGTNEDAGQEGLKTKAGKPAAEKGKDRKIWKYLIAVILILAVAAVYMLLPRGADNQKDTADPGSEPSSQVTDSNPQGNDFASVEPSVTFSVDSPKSYDAGEYKVGSDIPAGEYFFWTGEMLKPGSITVNDDTALSGELYCMTIRLNEYDTLVTDYRFTAAENVNPVKPTDGVLISGKYKIGKDIAPGTYTIKPIDAGTEGRYYSILDEEISNNTKFNNETTVTVPEEGYAVFYNAMMAVK